MNWDEVSFFALFVRYIRYLTEVIATNNDTLTNLTYLHIPRKEIVRVKMHRRKVPELIEFEHQLHEAAVERVVPPRHPAIT